MLTDDWCRSLNLNFNMYNYVYDQVQGKSYISNHILRVTSTCKLSLDQALGSEEKNIKV